MSTHQFNATDVLKSLRDRKKKTRRKAFQQSRLNKFRAELVSLRNAGASFRELTSWLSMQKRMKVTHTTVQRYLESLPELSLKEESTEQKVSSDESEGRSHSG